MQDKTNTGQGNAPENQERRKTIKKLAVGVGALAGYSVLPAQWIKPIVGQIVLPAHAQTSGMTITWFTLTIIEGHQGSDTLTVRAAGGIAPPTANQTITITVQGTKGTAANEQKGVIGNALASVSDFLVSDAVAQEACIQEGSAVTGPDGTFTKDFELTCGSGVTSVYAVAVMNSDDTSANASVTVPGEPSSPGSSDPATTPPATTPPPPPTWEPPPTTAAPTTPAPPTLPPGP